MDGNSRWAQQRHLPSFSGHQSGVDALRRTVEFSRNQDIKALTVFAFSSENWQRTNEEVEFLLMLIERVVKKELEELVAAGVNMQFIGDRSKLPSSLLDQMKRYERAVLFILIFLFFLKAVSFFFFSLCDFSNISNIFLSFLQSGSSDSPQLYSLSNSGGEL
jgi:hypothetical protein